jgi:hypothetical protein
MKESTHGNTEVFNAARARQDVLVEAIGGAGRRRAGSWRAGHRGGHRVGDHDCDSRVRVTPVTTTKVRLNIANAPGGPTIDEFQVF